MNPDPPAHAQHPTVAFPLTEAGQGRPVFLLHGGGGPATVAPIAAQLAAVAHIITPTHPGWDGTPRLAAGARVADVAALYLDYLAAQDLRDVLVIGSSLGGWIGCEMALQDRAGRITGLVLLDAVGIAVPGEPIRDISALLPHEITRYSFHAPERFAVDPATLPPAQVAARVANMATMQALAGDPYMHDPHLRERLGGITLPVLVVWGESDRIVTPAYGAAYAAAFPAARWELIRHAGHLPQIEQPAATGAVLATAL
jgi:pimeloyl-ACP methyl ester carboxylesterase